MGQLVDEIIALIALGDTRHPDESSDAGSGAREVREEDV